MFLNITATIITVSGISSGGYMASQTHIAHSGIYMIGSHNFKIIILTTIIIYYAITIFCFFFESF